MNVAVTRIDENIDGGYVASRTDLTITALTSKDVAATTTGKLDLH
jgi:hypothetical protein